MSNGILSGACVAGVCGLGSTMQSGPGQVYRGGSLGSLSGSGLGVLQQGPGSAYRDGSLGSAMQQGRGIAFREGSLGATLQRGYGVAFRDGSLGKIRFLQQIAQGIRGRNFG